MSTHTRKLAYRPGPERRRAVRHGDEEEADDDELRQVRGRRLAGLVGLQRHVRRGHARQEQDVYQSNGGRKHVSWC